MPISAEDLIEFPWLPYLIEILVALLGNFFIATCRESVESLSLAETISASVPLFLLTDISYGLLL